MSAVTPTHAAVEAPPPPKVPYRGIEPFRYVDQQIFFARQEEAQRLLRYVALYRGVLLYGASGTGKSSLISAGFIPAALAEGFTPDVLRVQPRDKEEIIVERIPASADGKPPYLPSNFAPDDGKSSRAVLSINAFRNTLKYLPPGARPLLIFDQFEEFITLFEEALTGPAAAEARRVQESLLDMLVWILRDQVLPVKVLLAFREDYLAKLSRLFALCPNLPDQYLRLLPPHVETLPKIICGPFDTFPGYFKRELSAELSAKLEAAVAERSELGAVNLSEVQIACLRLWLSKNPDDLFVNMGISGLLEDYLGAALYQLDAGLRDPARALLSRMVTSSGTRNVISGEDLVSLVHNEERIPEELLKEALDALEGETKLVRRERRHDTYFYEIVSEFLIPWISRQREERAQERLAEVERRRRRRAYAVAAAFAIFAIMVSVIAYVIVNKNREAVLRTEQVEKAQRERNEASKKLQVAEEEKADLERLLRQNKEQLENVSISAAIYEYLYSDADADRNNFYRRIMQLEPSPDATPPAQVMDGRKGITISYIKGNRGDVEQCWKGHFGYNLQDLPGNPSRANKIYCGSNVKNEDVMRVALCLMDGNEKVIGIEPLEKRSSEIKVDSAATFDESDVYNVERLNEVLEHEGVCVHQELRR